MKRGFSLMELIVVITIIALLAALIFPVFGRAKAAAKNTTCLSNLSQIGKAIALYMGDNDDLFPRAVDASDKYASEIWSGFPDWQQTIADTLMVQEALAPYSKSKLIYACPADTGTRTLDNNFPIEFDTTPSLFHQYGLSYFFRTEIAFSGQSQTSLLEPEKINVLFDAAGNWHGSTPAITPQDSLDRLIQNLRGFRYNVLFADFHAKSLPRDALDAAWATSL